MPPDVPPSLLSTLRVVPLAEAMAGPSLLVIREGAARRIPLAAPGEWSIGRAEECAVCVPDGSLSRRHATLRGGPPWEIEDLGGVNGSKVQGKTLAPRQPLVLQGGEVVELGLVTLVLSVGGGGEGAAASLEGEGAAVSLEDEGGTEVQGLRQGRASAERALIVETLARTQGNQTEAARVLGISRRMLLYKLDALGIERPRKGR